MWRRREAVKTKSEHNDDLKIGHKSLTASPKVFKLTDQRLLAFQYILVFHILERLAKTSQAMIS